MVNSPSITEYMQDDATRYKTNWMGSTRSLQTGKAPKINAVYYSIDPDATSPDQAVAMFNEHRYVELLQLPEGTNTFLRFVVYHDTGYDALFGQVESYIAKNVLSGISDVHEITDPSLKASVLAELANHKFA